MEDQSLATAVVLPAALAVIMLSLGLSLVPDDFRRVARFPRGVFIGLANLLVISPLLAFAMASGFGLEGALAAGLVLLGASPGGTMANMLTHLARGDVALSVTMTALSSVAAVIVVPLYLTLAVDHFNADVGTDVEMIPIVVRVFLITIVPLAPACGSGPAPPTGPSGTTSACERWPWAVFVGVVILAIAAEHEKVFENFAEVAGAAIALNLAAMTVSFLIAKGASLDDRQATAISMELGIHNATLAIAVGATVATELAIPAAVYSSFMFISGDCPQPAPHPVAHHRAADPRPTRMRPAAVRRVTRHPGYRHRAPPYPRPDAGNPGTSAVADRPDQADSVPALATTGRQDRPAGPGRHPVTEAVALGPLPVVGLVSALHPWPPRCDVACLPS